MLTDTPPTPPPKANAGWLADLRAAAQTLRRASGQPALRRFGIATAVLVAATAFYWLPLFLFAADSNLYSHIPLIPVVSFALVWMERDRLRAPSGKPAVSVAVACAAIGIALLVCRSLVASQGAPIEDGYALGMLGTVGLFYAVCAWFLGRECVRQLLFPLGFLVFTTPIPTAALERIQGWLQHASADAAEFMFRAAGTPLFRQDLVLQLPTIALEVAPQCSGIHSTLALFITSLVAGRLFLRSPWRRATLACAVAPLAVIRNGFRVFTIGELCVRVGPEMIDSYIHHRGGPIFFVLSLIPFCLLLLALMRGERAQRTASTSPTSP